MLYSFYHAAMLSTTFDGGRRQINEIAEIKLGGMMRARSIKSSASKSIKNDDKRIMVDLPELMQLTCSGRHTAERIAREAKAEIKIGGRRFYNIEKIRTYIDQISGVEEKQITNC